MQPPNTTQLLLEAPEAPPVPGPPDYLNLVSKPRSQKRGCAGKGAGGGGLARDKGRHFQEVSARR